MLLDGDHTQVNMQSHTFRLYQTFVDEKPEQFVT